MKEKILTTDTNFELNTGTIIYVTIGKFKFLVNEDLFSFNVEVEVENNGRFEFLEEIDFKENEIIIDHEDLKRAALNWIFKNVEMVQTELPFSDLQ